MVLFRIHIHDDDTFPLDLIGSVAGVYVGVDYGMEQIRGTNDWVHVCFLHKPKEKIHKYITET